MPTSPKLTSRERSVLSIASNAWAEREGPSGFHGVERKAVKSLVKKGLMEVTGEEAVAGVKGKYLLAQLTPEGRILMADRIALEKSALDAVAEQVAIDRRVYGLENPYCYTEDALAAMAKAAASEGYRPEGARGRPRTAPPEEIIRAYYEAFPEREGIPPDEWETLMGPGDVAAAIQRSQANPSSDWELLQGSSDMWERDIDVAGERYSMAVTTAARCGNPSRGLERLDFEALGRGVWRAEYAGHVYEIKGHPDRGYGVWRDGEWRLPGRRLDSLRDAKQAADDLAEFDSLHENPDALHAFYTELEIAVLGGEIDMDTAQAYMDMVENRCPPGELEVHRKGYQRDAYTRSDGTRVASAYVPPTTFCTTDQGEPGRGPQIIDIEDPGDLGGAGYTDKSKRERHRLLRKCVERKGYRSCLGKLQALEVLGKNTWPKKKLRVIAQDRKWLVEKFGGPGSFGPRKKKSKKSSGKRRNNPEPPRKFKLGDRVEVVDDGRVLREGEISFHAGYDEWLGQHKYKVLEDDGTRMTFNEDSLRKVSRGGRKKKSKKRGSKRKNNTGLAGRLKVR